MADKPYQFQPGQIASPNGRGKGTVNKKTAEMRDLLERIFTDEVYLENLVRAMQDRTIAPVIEQHLMNLHWGKPKERVEHTLNAGPTILKVIYPDVPQIESQPIPEDQIIDAEPIDGQTIEMVAVDHDKHETRQKEKEES